MAINESLCFVQFMHPGGEAKPTAPGFWRSTIEWNGGKTHARKYLRCHGTYLDGQAACERPDGILGRVGTGVGGCRGMGVATR